MYHHELIQMIDNCAQAAQRNDRDALASFPADWPDKGETDHAHNLIVAAFPAVNDQAVEYLLIIANCLIALETKVLPAMDPKDLMRLQIELAGFKSSFLHPNPAAAVSPITSNPAHN